MNYEVTLLKTIAECDALTAEAASEKVDLNYRILGLQKDQSETMSAAFDVDTKLAILNAEISGYKAKLADAGTTDSEKAAVNSKLQPALVKRANLLKKDESNNGVAILKRICNITRAQRELTELDTLIQEVTTHKATL